MTRRLALLAFLVCAAPAQADHVTFGSDLTGRATLEQAYPRDWAAWPVGITAPAQGEVSQVEVKGTVLKPDDDAAYDGHYPAFEFHVVVLRPQADGSVKLLSSTGALPYPFGGDDQQVTSFSLQNYPARMCVVPGDIVAMATTGGFGNHSQQYGGFPNDYFSNGYHVQMFARAPGNSYQLYQKPPDSPGAFQVGGTVSGQPQADQEVLMRVTVGTGADARYTCRTAAQQSTPTGHAPTAAKATVVAPAKAPKVRKHAFKVALTCLAGSLPCNGTLKLSNRSTVYATAPFALAAGGAAKVKLVLNTTGRKALKHRLTVKATATTDAGSTSQRFVIRKA